MANDFDLARFRLNTSSVARSSTPRAQPPRHARGEMFLKGPIPWAWLEVAGGAKGKALQVAMVLWLEAGMKRTAKVKLPHARLRAMGVDRHAARRGLAELEGRALVTVERRQGASPVVTLKGPSGLRTTGACSEDSGQP